MPYVPGDLTEEKYRDISYQDLAKHRYRQGEIHKSVCELKGYPSTREDFSRPKEENIDLKKSADEFYQKHREMLTEVYKGDKCYSCRKDKRLSSPIVAAIRNFDTAKKLHKENLEHHPLPDTVTDLMYRKLQMQGHREPGLALKEGNYASGVAWKAYAGYGPTRCTKLKVFRPKTSICHKIKDSANDRPSSVNSFDKKWRFIRQKKVTPIQLAVCWDLTPMNPKDEPTRTPHIDGSNGSLAPAVFSLVHTPKDELNTTDTVSEEVQKYDGLHDYTNYVNECRPKTTYTSKSCSNSHSTHASYKAENIDTLQSAHSSPKILFSPNPEPIFTKLPSNVSASHSSTHSYRYCSKECDQINKEYNNKRLCVACEMKNIQIKEGRPKSEYKMAFKAGVPQKVSKVYMNLDNSLRIPKMKDPYKEQKYSINTLAPPFSLQNLKRHDYPEHWRLATVYQHSYKPIQVRKRPLIQSIFK